MATNQFNYLSIKSEFFTKLITLITAALILVAGLAWNSAIQDLIQVYIPENNQKKSAWYKLYYALILTIIIVILLVALSASLTKFQKNII